LLFKRAAGCVILSWSDAQIQIAVRAQTSIRIQSSNSPTFHQNGFDTSRTKQGQSTLNISFVDGGLKGVQTIRLFQFKSRRRAAKS